jgi:hypothetical protein
MGSGASAILWPLAFNSVRDVVGLLLLVGLAKFLAGFVCVLLPDWRAFGAGLLTSLPIGFMIFFGTGMGKIGGL